MLSEAARKKRSEYQRLYRQRNPERVKQWQANHWEREALKDKLLKSSDRSESKQTEA